MHVLSKLPRLDTTQTLAMLPLSTAFPFHKLMCGDRNEEDAACYDGLVDEAAVTSEDAVSRQARLEVRVTAVRTCSLLRTACSG